MIELKKIQLTLGGKKVLADINAKAAAGELTLLSGDNGTGKTSLFNLIAGILKPDSGGLYYKSEFLDCETAAFSNLLSYIQDDGGTIPLLTVEEQLQLQCYLNNLNKIETVARVNEIIMNLDLESHRNYRAEELSAGVRKKLGIAIGMICNSEIFLLDEPFASLDIKASLKLLNILKILKKRGRIVIVTTHSPDIISKIIDRIWLLSEGIIQEETDRDKIKNILSIKPDNQEHNSDKQLSWIK